MAAFLAIWGLILKRSLAQGKLLLAVAFGVVLTITILASVPIYLSSIADLGIAHAFSRQGKVNLDIQLYAPFRPLSRQDYDTASSAVQDSIARNLRGLNHQ